LITVSNVISGPSDTISLRAQVLKVYRDPTVKWCYIRYVYKLEEGVMTKYMVQSAGWKRGAYTISGLIGC